MATCSDVYSLCASRIGTTFPDAIRGQCVAMITGVSRELGLGFNTFCPDGGARSMYSNALPAGWHKVAGDTQNDANAKRIWNSLPNGAIVFFWNALYGHVAVKSGNWGQQDDTIQQNWNTDGNGGPVSYGNCGLWCESGGAGFLGAWVSDENGPSVGPSGGESEGNNPTEKDNTALKQELIEKIEKVFADNLVKMSPTMQSNSKLMVKQIGPTITKCEINNETLQDIIDTITKATTAGGNSSSSSGDATGDGDENTEEGRAKIITQVLKKRVPNARACGIAGFLGNFMAESSIRSNCFEAQIYSSYPNGCPKGMIPTVENMFGSWSNFQRLYSISLNEPAYRHNGAHYAGIGLGQWTGPRAGGLIDTFGDDWISVQNQANYIVDEPGNGPIAISCLTNSEEIIVNGMPEGVWNVYRYWERANVPNSVPTRTAGYNKYLPLVKQWLAEME